jgi:hypothetical protein
MTTNLNVEELRKLLAMAEEAQVEQAKETPHTRLLGQLADHVVHPGELGVALARVFTALERLGVDLLAEDGPTVDVVATAGVGRDELAALRAEVDDLREALAKATAPTVAATEKVEVAA